MPLSPGCKFGLYTIVAKIGEGGMGEVWQATDSRLIRDVAIKALPERFASDPERARRFTQEARILAQLNHPNIAQIFGLEIEDNVAGLVMELVPGMTLSERLATGAFALAEAVTVARQITEALEEAHEKGIVHRDLKPQNIRITPGGRVKVLDFGLAKALSVGESGSETAPTLAYEKTQSGTIVGTAAYMSPEQARGEPIDRRTDIWSFGIVLYEMLSGRRLFDGESFVETLHAVLHQPIDFETSLSQSPEPLRQLIRRSLERDSKRRLRDIGEARLVLEHLSAPWPVVEANAKGIPSVAVLPFANMSADPQNDFFADGIMEDVIAHLAKVKTLTVTARGSVMALKREGKDLRVVAQTLGVKTLLEGSVRRFGNRVRIVAQLVDPFTGKNVWAETYDRELDDIFAIQTDVALHIASALRAELTVEEHARIGKFPTQILEAYQLYLQGRNQFLRYSKEGFVQSISFFERALALDPQFVLALTGMAHAYVELGIQGISDVVPLNYFAKAQAAIDRALALDTSLGEAHGIQGLILFVRDFNWQGAEAEFKRGLELTPGSADINDLFGWLYSAQGRFDESITYLRRARDLDPLVIRSDLANEFLRAGRVEAAKQEAKRALSVDPEFPRSNAILGWACLQLGETDEGLAALGRAVEFSGGIPLFRAQLGQAYGVTGHESKARAILAEFVQQAATEQVAPYLFAYLHTGLGEHDKAIDYLEQAFEQRSAGIYGIKGSYLFTVLREHPRFKALLGRMNL